MLPGKRREQTQIPVFSAHQKSSITAHEGEPVLFRKPILLFQQVACLNPRHPSWIRSSQFRQGLDNADATSQALITLHRTRFSGPRFGNRSGLLSMPLRIVSKSFALLWMRVMPVVSAVAAIIPSNLHLASLSVRDSARWCDLFGGVGGSGMSAAISPAITAAAVSRDHTRRAAPR